MAVIGTVTRIMPDTTVPAQETAQSNGAAFAAHAADGRLVGNRFKSAGQAQQAVNQLFGGRLLKWTRRDMAGGAEHWIGSDR
jgi:hypothetical protein